MNDTVKIAGFIVVRKPTENKDARGRGAYLSNVPHIDRIYYGGIDRMPWTEIGEVFYSGEKLKLPNFIRQFYTNLIDDNADSTGIEVSKNIDEASAALTYCNETFRDNDDPFANELICIRSDKLAQIKGSFDFDASRVKWLGYDIISIGHWSLLCDGLFVHPTYFANWLPYLNKKGLFSTKGIMDGFYKTYQEAVKAKQSEELVNSPYGTETDPYAIEAIEIGRVIQSND